MMALAVVGAVSIQSLFVVGDQPQTRSSARHRGSASIVARGSVVPSTRSEPRDEIGTLRLAGKVIDEARQPVAGARVTIADTAATSGTDGSFVFEKLVAKQYHLAARKGDLYAPHVSVRLTDASEPVVLRMRRGVTLIRSE